MYLYQIAKYNPRYRNLSGVYLINDWTSMSDIGKIYQGRVLDTNEYFTMENMYIKAAQLMMSSLKVERLKVLGLEKNIKVEEFLLAIKKYPIFYPDKIIEVFKEIKEGDLLYKDEIYELSRLVLREHLWCNMISEKQDFVLSFGFDYCIKIFCQEVPKEIINSIMDWGLFVEIHEAQEIELKQLN